jgi:thymidylate synthase (FAD)
MTDYVSYVSDTAQLFTSRDPLGDGISSIRYIDHLGGDLEAVNGARASYGAESQGFNEKDARLLARLGADQHHTPLRHVYVQLHIKAPEFVARQWYKHVVGCEYAFKDLPWSEFSQRYKEVAPEFYVPKEIRVQDPDNKQASIPTEAAPNVTVYMEQTLRFAFEAYRILLATGVAREQARLVLPMATYTEWTWTASIQACVHFAALRTHSGAQWEIQQFAQALTDIVRPLAPHTWDTLFVNHPLTLATK